MSAAAAGLSSPADLYLDLLKRVLTRYGFDEDLTVYAPMTTWKRRVAAQVDRVLARRNLAARRCRPQNT